MARGRALPKLLVSVLAILVPVGLVGLVRVAERRHWSAMLAESAAVESRLSARPLLRESAVGETREGSAWAHYSAALAAIDARALDRKERLRLRALVLADDATSRAERATWLAAWATELEELRRGVRARDATPPIDWTVGLSVGIPRANDLRQLADLSLAAGVASLEAGRPGQAVADLLGTMQLGHDLLDHPLAIAAVMGSGTVVPEVLLELFAERGVGAFDAASLDTFAAGLARLDAGWPRQLTHLEAELVLFVNHLERIEAENGRIDVATMFGEGRWVWRYLGSARAGLSDGVRTAFELVDRLGPEPTRAPAGALAALTREVEAHPNPVVHAYWSASLGSTVVARRDAAVRLRALRHGLALARGLPAPPIDDPFGHASSVTEEDGCVVVRTPRHPGRDPIEVRVRR